MMEIENGFYLNSHSFEQFQAVDSCKKQCIDFCTRFITNLINFYFIGRCALGVLHAVEWNRWNRCSRFR